MLTPYTANRSRADSEVSDVAIDNCKEVFSHDNQHDRFMNAGNPP
jgi:hypothetical protein